MTPDDILSAAELCRIDYPTDGSLDAYGLPALNAAVAAIRSERPAWAIKSDLAYALTLGQQRYTLGADVVGIASIRHTDGAEEPLEERTTTELDNVGPAGNGRPAYYVFRGGPTPQLEIWPRPDDDYTVRLFYHSTGTRATTSNSTSLQVDVVAWAHSLLPAELVAAYEQLRREHPRAVADAVQQRQLHRTLIRRNRRLTTQATPGYSSLPTPARPTSTGDSITGWQVMQLAGVDPNLAHP